MFIDGPYGTSTREIFETEHAVLICSGIGVTPYASILQNMMSKYKTSKQTCPQCEHSWYEDPPEGVMKCRKVTKHFSRKCISTDYLLLLLLPCDFTTSSN